MSKRRGRFSTIAIALAVVVIVSMSFASLHPLNASGSTPSGNYFDHVVIILMENNGYCNIITSCGGAGPYETSLANSFSIAGSCSSDSSCSTGGYTAVSHPSEPNYVALFGGSTNGITNDGQCCYQINSPNLVDRLQSSGLTWKAYAEDATNSGTCSFTPPRNGDHFPFKDFSDMDTVARCANFLTTSSSTGDSEFLSALNSNAGWANFYWLTPNDSNNGHNTGAAYGDNYLSNLVPKILKSSMFTNSRSALFIVYDEGNSNYPHDFLYASWSGSVVKHGYIGSGSYSHYSFLSTLEANWGFPSLTSNDAGASPMTEFFNPSSASSSSSSSNSLSTSSSATTTSSTIINGNFGSCNNLPQGWDCGSTDGLSGSAATINSGSFLATLNVPSYGSSSNYLYACTHTGYFPFDTTPGSTVVVNPNTQIVTATFIDNSFNAGNSSKWLYHIYIDLYYYSATGATASNGFSRHWIEAMSMVEDSNGVFSKVGTNYTSETSAFTWNLVTMPSVNVGSTYTISSNATQMLQGAMKAWGIPNTGWQLEGVEIGVEGYQFAGLSVAFTKYTMSIGNGITTSTSTSRAQSTTSSTISSSSSSSSVSATTTSTASHPSSQVQQSSNSIGQFSLINSAILISGGFAGMSLIVIGLILRRNS